MSLQMFYFKSCRVADSTSLIIVLTIDSSQTVQRSVKALL